MQDGSKYAFVALAVLAVLKQIKGSLGRKFTAQEDELTYPTACTVAYCDISLGYNKGKEVAINERQR